MLREAVESPSLQLFKTQLTRDMSSLLYILGVSCFEQEVGPDAFQRFSPNWVFLDSVLYWAQASAVLQGLEEKPVILTGEGTSFCRARTGIH